MKRLLAMLVLVAPLAACTGAGWTADEGQTAPGFGEAQSHNLAAQVVNPAAPDANRTMSMDGTKAEAGQTRYQQGKVIEPADVQIGTVGGSSGSSSGGGS